MGPNAYAVVHHNRSLAFAKKYESAQAVADYAAARRYQLQAIRDFQYTVTYSNNPELGKIAESNLKKLRVSNSP
jgi:hypothetical protein